MGLKQDFVAALGEFVGTTLFLREYGWAKGEIRRGKLTPTFVSHQSLHLVEQRQLK